jgi:hypothetical protein
MKHAMEVSSRKWKSGKTAGIASGVQSHRIAVLQHLQSSVRLIGLSVCVVVKRSTPMTVLLSIT